MEQRYKLTIFSKNIYQEVELLPESEKLKIGTTLSCDVRLRKDLFFCEFEIALVKNNESWVIQTTENIYLDFGGSQKKLSKPLEHGEQFCVRYSESDAELFYSRFFVDFDYENKQYDRLIDISQMKNVVIGTEQNAGIQLQGEYVYDDHMDIKREDSKLIICNIRSQYGVFLNGKRIETNTELKDYDFFSIANFTFYYKDGKLYTGKNSDIVFHGLQFRDLANSGNALEYPLFHRNTRVKVKLNEEEIPLLAPKQKPQKPKSNLILKLLPALSMIALTVVLRGIMGSTNLSFVLFSVCSMSVGAIVSVISIIKEKKEYKKEIEKRDKGYRSYIDTKRQEISEARAEEISILNQIYVPYEKTSSEVMQFSGDLFDRIPEDEDFLNVRIGIGNMDAIRKIEYKKQETYEADDDELVDLPVQLSEDLKQVQNAPVIVHLKDANVVGVVGNHDALYEMFKILFFDLCVRQYYHDVKAFLFVPSVDVRKYQWAKWFRHLNNDEIGCRNIICDEDSKNTILEYLYAELNRRENSKEKTFAPHLVVFVMDDYGINYHPVSRYIEKASELGCTFLFFEEKKEYIPVGCSQLILLKGENTGTILLTEDKTNITNFAYQSIPDRDIMMMAHRLAPVYCEEVNLEGALTKNITLYQLLGIFSEEDLDLKTRWACSDVTKSMAAPLGVRSGNEIVYLDIHDGEKAHGPHGLVAGTTGSGKSEILMTYILSMATLYSPYEVAFLIIDFKGGGMGNQFKDLPHTLGVITNIDGKEINRSLVSIKAELHKRQQLFAEAKVDHIDKYIRAYKSGEVQIPLPHLIIIVDEFAELKAAHRDFMDELISAARIGRSLGVHLILATQKPHGQVDDQIWSNSKFRLCLKVQTPEDSKEVIKTPLAAEIKEAGRAYLMVGNNEIFELFQSAYSGAPASIESTSNQKEFFISSVDFSGRKTVIFQKKHRKMDEDARIISQKEAATNWIIQYCNTEHIEKLPDICQPPLPHILQHESIKNEEGFVAGIGVFDNPYEQLQDIYKIDFTVSNTLIIGSPQSGKTNILQLIIRTMAEQHSPNEVVFYVIDFASMILKKFEKLNHVGGVVTPVDDDKLRNLFKLLNEEIENRKEKLISVGVSSFKAYQELGKTDLPQIILMIDNLTILRDMFFKDNDEDLLFVFREGISVGISIVATNLQATGISYKYFSNFSDKIALFCNDSNEYATIFGHCKDQLDDICGRCFIVSDNKRLECQSYLAFHGDKETDRVESINEFIKIINNRYKGNWANKIPVVPKKLLYKSFLQNNLHFAHDRFEIPCGINYSTVNPYFINFAKLGLLAVTGKADAERYSFLQSVIRMLSSVYENQLEVYVVDDVERHLETLKCSPTTLQYTRTSEDVKDILSNIEKKLEERYQEFSNGNDAVLDNSSLLMLLINNMDGIKSINGDKNVLQSYRNIMGRYRNMNICILVSCIENSAISFSAPDMVKDVKEIRHVVYFDDIANIKMFDVPFASTKQFKKKVTKGDCFYINDSEVTKLKVPQDF